MSKETTKINKNVQKKKVNQYTADDLVKEMARVFRAGGEQSKYYRDMIGRSKELGLE